MKSEIRSILVIVVAAILLGLVIGASSAALRARDGASTESNTAIAPQGSDKAVAPTASAKVEVDSDRFDFGEMDTAKEGSHDFVFTNKGTLPLTLTQGESSCRCTVGELSKSHLPPGESTTVRVKWKSKNIGGAFKQSVTIKTDDPKRPEVVLSITGTFSEVVRVDPAELNFGQLVGSGPFTGEAHILCNLPNRPLEIAGFEFVKEDLAEFFDVKTRPMTVDELVEQRHFGSGILVTVTAKPGLPQGRFLQRILLRTNLPHPQDEVELDVTGLVGKEVSVVGNGWDEDIGVLNLGRVKVGTGVQRQLFLVAHGTDARKIRYNVVHVEPDFLKVKLGEPDVSEGGKLSRTRLTIEVPAVDKPASYLDDGHGKAGEIDIDTTSTEVHQVKMRVRFAVEGEK
jgi:hypothetical protein